MGASESSISSENFSRLAVRWFRSGAAGVQVRQYQRGQAIYVEHDPATTVLCIDTGNVRLVVDTPDGRECPLGLRVADELFGELCICGQSARKDSAIALEQVTVRSVSTRAFMEFVQRENLVGLLLQHLGDGLIAQQRSIAILLLEPSERRLAHTLLELSQRVGDSDQIPLKLSQEQLGDMIGTTRSRVGQFLKNFRALGLVLTYDSSGVQIDRERLRAYCR